MKFWGYKHVNGSIHTKRYLSEADVDEAFESSFVEDVMEPFEAKTAAEAQAKVKAYFDPNKGAEDEIGDRLEADRG